LAFRAYFYLCHSTPYYSQTVRSPGVYINEFYE
jgi:hypothetical protein